MNELLNEIHVNLNMLGPLMLDWIPTNVNSALIVTKDDSRFPDMNTKLKYNTLKLDGIYVYINKPYVLCLYGRYSNSSLLLARLTHRTRTQRETIT